MDKIEQIKLYLKKIIEVALLLLGVFILVEILFGTEMAFGLQVTTNLGTFLSSIGDSGIAALIAVFALIYAFRRKLTLG